VELQRHISRCRWHCCRFIDATSRFTETGRDQYRGRLQAALRAYTNGNANNRLPLFRGHHRHPLSTLICHCVVGRSYWYLGASCSSHAGILGISLEGADRPIQMPFWLACKKNTQETFGLGGFCYCDKFKVLGLHFACVSCEFDKLFTSTAGRVCCQTAAGGDGSSCNSSRPRELLPVHVLPLQKVKVST